MSITTEISLELNQRRKGHCICAMQIRTNICLWGNLVCSATLILIMYPLGTIWVQTPCIILWETLLPGYLQEQSASEEVGCVAHIQYCATQEAFYFSGGKMQAISCCLRTETDLFFFFFIYIYFILGKKCLLESKWLLKNK